MEPRETDFVWDEEPEPEPGAPLSRAERAGVALGLLVLLLIAIYVVVFGVFLRAQIAVGTGVEAVRRVAIALFCAIFIPLAACGWLLAPWFGRRTKWLSPDELDRVVVLSRAVQVMIALLGVAGILYVLLWPSS